jgi:anti-sigma factor RsiW
MRCHEVLDLLADLGAVGAMPPPAQQHLQGCASCSAQARLLEKIEIALRSVPQVEEPAEFTDRFLEKLEAERTRRAMRLTDRLQVLFPPSRRWKLGFALAVAAAHLLALSPVSQSVVGVPTTGARYTAEVAPKLRQEVVSWARQVSVTILGSGGAPESPAKGKNSGSWLPETDRRALPAV